MARETKAYLCDYRCGHAPVTKRKAMEEHEGRCKRNPARRTCATCEHQYVEDYEYGCNEDHVPEGQSLVYDCPFHKLKSGRE